MIVIYSHCDVKKWTNEAGGGRIIVKDDGAMSINLNL